MVSVFHAYWPLNRKTLEEAGTMPELTIYANTQLLPTHIECQIRSFIRIAWFDAFQFDLNATVTPDEWHPVHVVLAEQHVVLAYAGVVWRNVEHERYCHRQPNA